MKKRNHIIPVSDLTIHTSGWQDSLKTLIRDPYELLQLLKLEQDPDVVAAAYLCAKTFPLRVTHSFVRRMVVGDINDPLLRQVLPVQEEMEKAEDYTRDPVGEVSDFVETQGLIHKYQNRALIMATGACAIHCRYCFRRHFPYSDNSLTEQSVTKIVDYVSENKLSEIILSGGDPLMLSTEKLASLVNRCLDVPSVKTLRIHTRLPVVLPERLDDEFVAWWNAILLNKVMVIHANHASELDETVANHLSRLEDTLILNQAVLLKGVNDSANAIIDLCQRSFDIGVQPYYLHLLDKVEGSTHFGVNDSEAKKIMAEVTSYLPGYLVPKLVREEAGAESKTRIV